MVAPIKDKSIAHALQQGYSRWIPHGRYPQLVMFLTVDPTWVDVNVHPAKTEVRFTDARLLHDYIYKTVKHALSADAGFAQTVPVTQTASVQSSDSPTRMPDHIRSARSNSTASRPQQSSFSMDRDHEAKHPQWQASAEHLHARDTTMQPSTPGTATSADGHEVRILGQIMAKYILAEVDQSLWMIDQHAAHEALNYVRIRNLIQEGKSGATQMLLVPSSLSLEDTAFDALARESVTLRVRWAMTCSLLMNRLSIFAGCLIGLPSTTRYFWLTGRRS